MYFGVDRQRYHIQNASLKKLENPPLCIPLTSEKALDNVKANTGRNLIDFLNTSTYQTLDKTNDKGIEPNKKDIVINNIQQPSLSHFVLGRNRFNSWF